MISERARRRQEALDRTREARRKVLDDPAIKARSQKVLDEIARGDEPRGAGITEEELPDFLREHNG